MRIVSLRKPSGCFDTSFTTSATTAWISSRLRRASRPDFDLPVFSLGVLVGRPRRTSVSPLPPVAPRALRALVILSRISVSTTSETASANVAASCLSFSESMSEISFDWDGGYG